MKTTAIETSEQAAKVLKDANSRYKKYQGSYAFGIVPMLTGVLGGIWSTVAGLTSDAPAGTMVATGLLSVALAVFGFVMAVDLEKKTAKLKKRVKATFVGTEWKTPSGRPGLVTKIDMGKERVTLDLGAGDKADYRLKKLTFVSGKAVEKTA